MSCARVLETEARTRRTFSDYVQDYGSINKRGGVKTERYTAERPAAARGDQLLRKHPGDAYRGRPRAQAVETARLLLRDAERHSPGVTWHACRHTFARRLVGAGGSTFGLWPSRGWRTLAMVQRYAHLALGRLTTAVERLTAVARF